MTKPLAALLCLSMVVPFAAPAQVNDRSPGRALTIAVLQGDGAIHDLRTGVATFPVVEVRDDAMKPVAGAEVTFELPAGGPGGQFAGGASTAQSKTTAAGQARAPEFIPNRLEGRFFIQVTARLGDRIGAARIEQTNSANPAATRKAADRGTSAASGPSKLWRVLAIAAGSATTVGVVLLTRGSGSGGGSVGGAPTPSGPSVTLTPGTITVGGPR
jgi:hypothetical protein